MRLAQMLNLNVPKTELSYTDGRPYLEIERYDRVLKGGKIYRIHQEDFCQALGLVSDMKYQKGGGASLKACLGVINDFSSNKLIDIVRFIEWILFNYFIGNTDSHAKNISLLHTNSGIILAPFYDLLSTEVYPEKIVDHQMAMLISGKGRYNSLKAKDFTTLFESLGLNAVNMNRSLREKFANIINLAEECKEWCIAQDNTTDNKIYDDIIAIIKKRFAILFNES
jgi:serine/threonine-protein kinase HipA